jgi:D-3-phosphoglycerate dehydrogenase
MTPLVVLTQGIDADALSLLQRAARVQVLPDTAPDTIRQAVAQAHAVMVRAPLPDDVFACGPGLLGAVRHGAGVDMIPIDAATQAGVPVANVPGVNAATVAEYVLGQMLQSARRLARVDQHLRSQGWLAARALADSGRDLGGRTLGIVGAGAIGAALARAAGLGLGMRVLGHRRSIGPLPEPMQRASLDDLLEQADYLALCCPLTEQTRGLIGARELARMKPGAVLVNVSRGPVVVESALIAALASGHLGGAVLDVYQTQPLPADSPLRGFDNVLLSPHMAGITADSMRRMGVLAVQQTLDLLAGRRPAHLVNPEVWPHRRRSPFDPTPETA